MKKIKEALSLGLKINMEDSNGVVRLRVIGERCYTEKYIPEENWSDKTISEAVSQSIKIHSSQSVKKTYNKGMQQWLKQNDC